jgi:hypothetical protein
MDTAPAPDEALPVPFSTGFERDFCDFVKARGFCYANPDASFEIVGSPVHSGRAAAAFHMAFDPGLDGLQARCTIEGTLRAEAIYGAWFFVPEARENADNWNLMHFRGADEAPLRGLWDVSIGNNTDGTLYLYLFDFFRGLFRPPTVSVPIEAASCADLAGAAAVALGLLLESDEGAGSPPGSASGARGTTSTSEPSETVSEKPDDG